LGVALTSEQYSNVLDSVRAIDLDPSFCLRNRYWDPFDLRLLRDSFEASGIRDLPNSVWQPGFANTLKEWLQFHAAAVPYYFDRYFGTAGSERFFIAVAKSSETWSRESPLKKIVDDRHFYANDSSLIDSQIGLIYKHVIFGVPSLLKPLAEMRGHGGPSLAAIESGTYHPISRFLVSRGMFRETAVEIRRHIFYDMGQFEVKADAEILSQLSSASESDTLGPWVRRQISTFIN
jgi:hypothetical protein